MSYLGEDIKKLGFGLMRLPQKDERIDIEQTKQMVDAFLSAGFTYFDTAWAYEGSEDAIRQALVERYPRESFHLATKNAAWINCKTREDAIAKMQSALGEVIIEGIDTNVDYQFEILQNPDYQAGNFDIEFLNTHVIAGVNINEI